MTMKELTSKARSYRNFDSDCPVSREQLTALVELAQMTSTGANLQPLKFWLSWEKQTNDKILPLTKWAGRLKDWKLPQEGKEPQAYIVICVDTTIAPNTQACLIDVGMAAQSIMLGAVEAGLNGCFLGAFSQEKVAEAIGLPGELKPQLIVALGKAAACEDIRVVPAENGDIAYYRTAEGVHFVPKRSLDELIV